MRVYVLPVFYCVRCVALSDVVDKCRRSGELTVTYNPSFTSFNASPTSPSSSAAAGGAGGAGLVSSNQSVASPSLASSSRSTSNSSFSPHSSACRPMHSKPHTTMTTQSREAQPPPPLHRPHSVTGLSWSSISLYGRPIGLARPSVSLSAPYGVLTRKQRA